MRPIIIVPVGPSDEEVRRAQQLLSSLRQYETEEYQVLLVDDGLHHRRLDRSMASYHSCDLNTLYSGCAAIPGDIAGNCSEGLLRALKVVVAQDVAVPLCVKLDTDSLVIGPFIEQIKSLCDGPQVGIVGTIEVSSNRDEWTGTYKQIVMSTVIRLGIINRLDAQGDEALASYFINWGDLDIGYKDSLKALARQLEPLYASDYSGENPQGGAYAISGKLIASMTTAGVLESPSAWRGLTTGDDQMMGIYCAAFGYKLIDCSSEGGVFGVRARGLPFPLSELRRRNYRIIHSVKNDARFSEQEIVRFFDACCHR